MPSLTFPVKTAFVLSWTLTDTAGNPINNATVIANLYAGRSRTEPEQVPGTPVVPIVNFALSYVNGSAGIYSATVPGTLDPPLDGTGYVLVIDATVSGQQIYHCECPVAVDTAGSTLDLTSVDQVKDWIPGLSGTTSTPDDAKIQFIITAWSFEFLHRTGRGDQSGDYHQSPYTSVCQWNETYDGSGTERLFLRNRPIVSIQSLVINGIPVAASPGYPTQGYVIDGTRKSISMRGGMYGMPNMYWNSWQAGPYHAFAGSRGFPRGLQNISVSYSAGYSVTPADIVQCANIVVAQNYSRPKWIDEESRAMAGGGGTTRYRSWDVPVECQLVVDRYTRTL